MKHWETIGYVGTVFILRDVPKKALEDEKNNSDYTCSILEKTIDREALQAEKEKLMRRLSEIDKLLGE